MSTLDAEEITDALVDYKPEDTVTLSITGTVTSDMTIEVESVTKEDYEHEEGPEPEKMPPGVAGLMGSKAPPPIEDE